MASSFSFSPASDRSSSPDFTEVVRPSAAALTSSSSTSPSSSSTAAAALPTSSSAVTSPSAALSASALSSSAVTAPASSASSDAAKTRKLSTSVWTHYEAPVNGKAQCKYCTTKITSKEDHSSGTSALWRHHERQHKEDKTQPKLALSAFDPALALDKLQNFILGDQQAFTITESGPFIDFVKALQPGFKLPKADTVRRQLLSKSSDKHSLLKQNMIAVDSQISITTDAWSAPNADHYLGVTAHWIDQDFKTETVLLGFLLFHSPHTAANAFELIWDLLGQWEIQGKVRACVTDNTASAYNISSLLANKVSPRPFGQMRCRAHVLQLVVKDALKDPEVKLAIDRARALANKTRKSDPMQAALEAACEKWEIQYRRPFRDMDVRWNSTFTMIEALTPMRQAIIYLQQSNRDFKDVGFPETLWDGLEEVVKVLRSFQVATVWLQGQRYQTLSELLQMHDVLVTDVSEMEGELETELGKRLALFLSAGLEDRRELIAGCYITQWAGVLDPTVKTKLLEKHGDAEEIMNDMCFHIDTYYPAPPLVARSTASASSGKQDGYKNLKRRHNGNMVQAVRESSAQLRKYLSEPPLQPSETDDENDEQNPLAYWKLHQQRFPQLAKLARDILAIPATTAASESAFSRSKLLITDRRTRLNEASVSALMCLDNWYHRCPSIFQSAPAAST